MRSKAAMHAKNFALLIFPASFGFLTGCNTTPLTGMKSSPSTELMAPNHSDAKAKNTSKTNEETTKVTAEPGSSTPQEAKQDASKPINLTPLSTYTDEWTNNAPKGASFSGAYTRVVIFSDLPADGDKLISADKTVSEEVRPLAYTPRPLWLRALVGKEFSVNLTAKITIGAFESTIPLATIGHQSNSDGEQWNRAIYHSNASFPLFLVKADGSASIPTIKLSVNGTKSYSSRGAAAAVQVALGVARATGQPASVITRLTEQTTKDRARAIDDAISKLFASGITEEHWTDRDLKLWSVADNNQLRGVKVKFSIPGDEQDWNSKPSPVGTWTISFDYPRPSIFSDWRVCKTNSLPRCSESMEEAEANVLKEINPSEVLNYVLVNSNNGLGTIRAFVSQQDWYVSAQSALANSATANATASSLCRRIVNEIVGLGLNCSDARIVAWAVTKGMPLPVGVSTFSAVEDCNQSNTLRAQRKK